METTESFWKKCSSCKKPIEFGAEYYTCSVSTCNGQRTGYVFCSVPCFERHLPGARHKDAGAVNQTAPARTGAQTSGARQPARIIVKSAGSAATTKVPATAGAGATPPVGRSHPGYAASATPPVGRSHPGSVAGGTAPQEILIIASRLKEYIQLKADFNTSASVMDVLSHHVRRLCDEAIDNARADGRKTVLDRDFKF